MTVLTTDIGSPSAPSAAVFAEGRALMRLAAPIVLIALVNMGMGVTDAAMISALYGTEAFAAVAVGSDLYSILFYFGAGVLAGVSPLYTAAVVSDDVDSQWRLRRTGATVAGLLALVLGPILWTSPGWLAWLGLDVALLDLGAGYTRAMSLTLVPMLGVALYRTILTASEKPKVFLCVTLAMMPLNAMANWAFMLGVGPLPAFGATGAGLSSLIVASASLVILMLVARGGLGRTPDSRIDWDGVGQVLRIGVPIGVATVAEVGIFLGATVYAASLGAAAVAAHTLALRTAGIAYAIPTGLLQAAMVRMSRAQSSGDPGARCAVVASAAWLSVGLGGLVCLFLVWAAEPLSSAAFDVSSTGMAATALAGGLLVLLGIMEAIGTPGAAASGLLRGQRDTRAPTVYSLLGHWAVGAPVGIYLCEAEAMGVTGLWVGLTMGTLITTCLLVRRMFRREGEGRSAIVPI